MVQHGFRASVIGSLLGFALVGFYAWPRPITEKLDEINASYDISKCVVLADIKCLTEFANDGSVELAGMTRNNFAELLKNEVYLGYKPPKALTSPMVSKDGERSVFSPPSILNKQFFGYQTVFTHEGNPQLDIPATNIVYGLIVALERNTYPTMSDKVLHFASTTGREFERKYNMKGVVIKDIKGLKLVTWDELIQSAKKVIALRKLREEKMRRNLLIYSESEGNVKESP